MQYLTEGLFLAIVAVAAGAGSTKAILNGTAKRVESIDNKLDQLMGPDGPLADHAERIAKLEARRR